MDFSGFQQSASALLAMGGQQVTITPPGTGTYDPATSTVSGSGGTQVTTTGVVLPLSRGLTHMPGTDIQSGDMQLLLPGTIAEPAVDTTVIVGSKTYTIIEVAAVNPNGTPVYFDCIVRGSQPQ